MDDLRKRSFVFASAVIAVLLGLGSGCSSPSTSANAGDADQLAATREMNQQQETLALAKNMYMKLINDGAGVRSALEELRHLHDQWEKEILPLLQNDDGKFLTSNGESVSAFREHFGTIQPLPKGSIEQLESALSTLLAPIESVVKAGAVVSTPDPKFAPMLADISGKVQSALLPYKEAVPALQALASKAKSEGRPGERTLEQALGELTHANALTRAARIKAAREEVEEAMTEKLAQAEQELMRAKKEQEIQAAKDEAARVYAQTVADTLKAKATNPDTLARLKPFITKTTTRYESTGPGDHRWIEKQMEESPFSFSALSRSGGLEPTTKGVETLHFLATFHMNDRPAWPSSNSPKDWEWVKENQELLRELGPTLVSLGHLAP